MTNPYESERTVLEQYRDGIDAVFLERDALRAEVKRLNKEIDRLKKILAEHHQDNWEALQRRIKQETSTHPGWREDLSGKEPWEKPIKF